MGEGWLNKGGVAGPLSQHSPLSNPIIVVTGNYICQITAFLTPPGMMQHAIIPSFSVF